MKTNIFFIDLYYIATLNPAVYYYINSFFRLFRNLQFLRHSVSGSCGQYAQRHISTEQLLSYHRYCSISPYRHYTIGMKFFKPIFERISIIFASQHIKFNGV